MTLPPDFDQQLDALEGYPKALKAAIAAAGDRLPDVTGIMHSNNAQVRDIKRLAQSELEDGDTGTRWRTVIDPKNDYSFNTPGLFAAFLTKWKDSFTDMLLMLIAEDAIRLQWQLTNTRNLASRMGVELTIVHGTEVSDGDPTRHIGKVPTKAYPKYEPVFEEDDAEGSDGT
jgi:hypothetical protein